ncbi:MFS-type transporter SLC18B1-like [Sycon ciliatum]|uniref:MFS-type transporter SLC18B1-like n=1 Tax=Sycon ciliatum TaxID=27933 RepID=UPI0031F60BA8|eukprot:scpid38405/ scgid21376/ MFS-type transporter SLC18B1; Solute carrier family 18 member B1
MASATDHVPASTYGAINDDVGTAATNSGAGNKEDENVKMFSSRRDKLVFLCLAVNNLIVSICFATMVPFFPTVAATKSPSYHIPTTPASPVTTSNGSTVAPPVTATLDETSSTLIGLVFSVATFSDFVFSPIVGHELPKVGPKLIFLLGCILISGVTILFGFVDMVDDWSTFLGLCYALRFAQGMGTACMFTSSFTILAGAFPKSVGMVTGTLEVFSGLGFMIGPAIGGALYGLGGFKLPFLVSGSTLAACTGLVAIVLPSPPARKKQKVSLLTVLSQPRTWLLIPSALLSASALGFLDPSLSPYLDKEFGLSPSKIGLVFLTGAGVYAILAPLVGFIGDKYSTRPLIPLGLLLTGVSYQLLGPSPLLGLQPALWRTICGLALMGSGIALSLVPTSPDMLVTMCEKGYEDSLELHSALGGVMGAAFSFGEGLGPSVGGLLFGAVGFSEAASIFGAMILAHSVVVTIGTLLGRLRRKSVAVVDANIQDETKALLQSDKDDDAVRDPERNPRTTPRILRRSLSHSRVPTFDANMVTPTSVSRSQSTTSAA